MSDNVNHPSHYTDGKIEVIECKESQLNPYQAALKAEANDIKKHLKGFVIKMAIRTIIRTRSELWGILFKFHNRNLTS